MENKKLELTEDEYLDKIINSNFELIRCYYPGNRAEKIESIINYYKRKAEESLFSIRNFQQELIVWLRALAMVAEMAGNSSTHREKAARVRGMIEIIETCIEKATNMDINFSFLYFNWPNLWRSDYPVRKILQENHELKKEIDRLQNIKDNENEEVKNGE